MGIHCGSVTGHLPVQFIKPLYIVRHILIVRISAQNRAVIPQFHTHGIPEILLRKTRFPTDGIFQKFQIFPGTIPCRIPHSHSKPPAAVFSVRILGIGHRSRHFIPNGNMRIQQYLHTEMKLQLGSGMFFLPLIKRLFPQLCQPFFHLFPE